MIGCVLRASGSEFDVDAFLDDSPFEPCAVWRRGEQRFRHKPPSENSGFNLEVSDGDLAEQVAGAVVFLEDDRAEILRLLAMIGVEAHLDFGIARRDVFVQTDFFPSVLIGLAGSLGLGIELSQYPVSNEPEVETAVVS